MTLNEEERAALEQDIRAELEAEHARREAQAQARRQKRLNHRQDEQRKLQEVEALRNTLRRQFYEEHGYQQTRDTTGREVWLSPAELAVHSRVQHRRRKRYRFAILSPQNLPRLRDIALFVLMCGAAVGIGLFLAR